MLLQTITQKIFQPWMLLLIPLGVYVASSQEIDPAPDDAQEEEEKNSSTLGRFGTMSLRVLLVEDFEDADSWVGDMPRDRGVIVVKKRSGAPNEIKQKDPIKHQSVLGAKVAFFRTGYTHFTLKPPRPIAIPGITKSISIWVAGRNHNHRLYALIRDLSGKTYRLPLGEKLNFSGWTKLTGQVPPWIIQNDLRYIGLPGKQRGLYLMGLYVKCALDETVGTYYFYADQLEVQSDMFLEDERNRNTDDMVDDW